MDGFVEKLIKKKKTPKDIMISVGIIVVSLVVAVAVFFIVTPYLGLMTLVLPIGILYLGINLEMRTNLEFEYLVTNDCLDIDKIVAQKKRIRIFSGSCKEFETVAKVSSTHYGYHVTNGAEVIFAGSAMDAVDLYFIALSYQGRKTVVYFEPNARMLEYLKRFIPRKILG